jgi:PAS domain S-box-containing protein
MKDHGTISILYLEDEDDARQLLLATLRRSLPELQIFSGTNGLEGLELFREHQPRIVLTDIRMPGMGGIELSAAIKRMAPETIIIATSAYSDTDFLLKAIEIGINHFVMKPLNFERLFATIDRAIGVIRLEQQVLSQAKHIEKLSRAVEQSPSTVVITDKDGTIEYVNPKFSLLTGYSPEEARGQNPRILKSGLMDPAIYEDLWKTITSGREWRGEMLNRKKNGDLYWESASISPLLEASGEITSYIAVKEDITQRKAAELEITELNRNLASRADELEAANSDLEAFNYTVSHDLRTPLTTIGGFAQLLMKKPHIASDPESVEFLQIICRSVERMEELTDSLLELSRLTHQKLDTKRVNLSELADLISLELRVTAPERQVDFAITDGIFCDGDKGLLRVMLANLLGNAWKYSARRNKACIAFGFEERDGETCCFVRDNGAGFDGQYADKLFTCFNRLHSSEDFAGLGIGLATVKRIISRHGGMIRAEGETDRGATFYFSLPALTLKRGGTGEPSLAQSSEMAF